MITPPLLVAVLIGMGESTYPKFVDHSKAFTTGYTALSTTSQTGYLPVSDSSEIFYWLFKSNSDFESKPLLVWVQGQIGVSSLVGTLIEFKPEWTDNFNLLFVDTPVGVGFSTGPDVVTTSEEIASQTIFFLKKFFKRHSELTNKKIIIAGEDYAGHTIPLMANLALQRSARDFQLTGIAIGNGHTHAPIQVITKAESAIVFGLIDGACIPDARMHAWNASFLSVSRNFLPV